MMKNYNFSTVESQNIFQNVTIVPRLEYSTYLLSHIIEILYNKEIKIKKTNHVFLDDDINDDKTCLSSLDVEKKVALSIEILSQIQKRICMISGITSIPKILPSTIPMIRTISAQLFDTLPECSQKLSELSVNLGSIILDSATLTKASFDFSLSNEESTVLIDKVKLMVDSKINKQYPNLDFLKA